MKALKLLALAAATLLFVFGSATGAHAAVIEVSDPSKSTGPSAGEFDLPDCGDRNGDRHQPDESKGYRWAKTVNEDTVTLKAVPLNEGDVIYAADDDDATYTYDVPSKESCDPSVPIDPEPSPTVDRSDPVDRAPQVLPNVGALDGNPDAQERWLVLGLGLIVGGIWIRRAIGKHNPRH